jgi:hypothetical protein
MCKKSRCNCNEFIAYGPSDGCVPLGALIASLSYRPSQTRTGNVRKASVAVGAERLGACFGVRLPDAKQQLSSVGEAAAAAHRSGIIHVFERKVLGRTEIAARARTAALSLCLGVTLLRLLAFTRIGRATNRRGNRCRPRRSRRRRR